MDKCAVNNFVVQMRASVAQARVHLLNKLIRESQKLKSKKGSDQQKEKNCRKAERLTKEAMFMKKLEADEISRFALLYTDNISGNFREGSLPLEERTKIRLATYKSIAVQVKIFRKRYPEWELKLPPLLVQLGLKNRYKKNNLQSQSEIRKAENCKETSNSEKEDKTKQEKHNENKTDLNETKQPEQNLNLTTNRDTREHVCEEINKQICAKDESSMKENERKKKNTGIAEVRRFADLLKSQAGSIEDSSEVSSNEDSDLSDSNNAVTDPFFLKGDDSGESDEDVNNERGVRNNDSQIFLKNTKEHLGQVKQKYNKQDSYFERENKREMNHSRDQTVPVMNRKQRRMMERAMKGNNGIIKTHISHPKQFANSVKKRPELATFNWNDPAKTEEQLHPSWEAKRKQRELQIILPFQGKKIKFEDDD